MRKLEAARTTDKIPRLGMVSIERDLVFYKCNVCEFSSQDPREAQLHLREANRHVRSKWWRHELHPEEAQQHATESNGAIRSPSGKLEIKRIPNLEPGTLVWIRYKDHALHRNIDPVKATPIVREATGRIERETEDYLFIVVDEYLAPGPDDLPTRKTTGLVILRNTILEMKRLA